MQFAPTLESPGCAMGKTNNNRNNGSQMYHRRSIRLQEYDYFQSGAYFVTICTYKRQMLFADIRIKKIVEEEWLNTGLVRPNVIIDEFVVMPNHLHGIIVIQNHIDTVSTKVKLGSSRRGELHLPNKFKSPSQTIGAVIRGFKASSYRKIIATLNMSDMLIWQRNYYEHIIRNEVDLSEKRKYIIDNPAKWNEDEYYSNNPSSGGFLE